MKGKGTKSEQPQPDRTRADAVFLRKARKKLKLTQQQLADKLGESKQNISHVENGRQGLAHTKWLKLSKWSGVPMSDVGPAQASLETDLVLQNFERLPVGLKAHVANKVADLLLYYETLPAFLRDSLIPPKDPIRYREWEREIEGEIEKLKQQLGKK